LSGLFGAESSVIEIDEVFEANIESDLTIEFNSLKTFNLTSLFSKIASITRSVSAGTFSIPTTLLILERVASLSLSVMISFLTCLSRFLEIMPRALSKSSSFISTRLTS